MNRTKAPPPESIAESPAAAADPLSGINNRLRSVIGSMPCEEVGRLFGVSGESVRRYLAGRPPSAKLLAAICKRLRIDGTWLLTGQGQPRESVELKQSLDRVETGRLMLELGRRMEHIMRTAR